jgi:hypothetical protein
MRASFVVTALLATAACVPEEGPSMRPGEDCLGCHDGGEARAWTVAGTWGRGAAVTVTDAAGKSLTLYGNAVGNFYTAESLTFPLKQVSVDGGAMQYALDRYSYGGCNRCHGGGGDGGGGGGG